MKTAKLNSCSKIMNTEEIFFLQSDESELATANYEEVNGNSPDESINVDKSVQASVACTNKITQTDDSAVQLKVVVQATSVDAFVDDPECMQFYTGLESVHIFNGVLASLGPASFKLRYMYATPNLDVRNQLFL